MAEWTTTLPGETNSFAEMPQICQDQFGLIEDTFGEEHSTMNEAACGTHIPGVAGVTKSASTTIIGALALPGSGALAWDTTVGWWKRYWASAWGYPGSATKWSRVRAYAGANQNLTSVNGGSQTATIAFNTEDYDSLAEFAANTFTPADSGYYLVMATWCASGATTGAVETCSTYPASAVTEKWSASMTSRPTADISTGWTTFPTVDYHYDQIDEVNCDLSNGLSATTTVTDRFQHSKFAIPAGSTIGKVQVVVKGRNLAEYYGYPILYGQIRVGTTWYQHATHQSLPASTNYLIFNWATNPAGGSWTVDQINEAAGSNNLSGFGLANAVYGVNTAYVYQAYLKVDYTLANNNYANIDESTADDENTLWAAPATSGTANVEVLSAATGANIPTSTSDSLSATLYVRAKCLTATGTKLKGVIRCGSTNYYSTTEATLTDDFANYGFVWDTNPSTLTSWTSGDFAGSTASALSGYGFYISTGALASTAIISQCYIKMDWNSPPSTMSILLRKGGTVVASATKQVQSPGLETDDQVKLSEMVYLTAGQTLDVQAQKTVTNDVIMSGQDLTYVAIHRLGSQGM